MKESGKSRREFLKTAGAVAGAALLTGEKVLGRAETSTESGSADYTLHIQTSPIELAPNRIVSVTTYNGQFPGPLLRLKEGQRVTVDVYQRHRHPGAVALAWSKGACGCGWRFRGRHPIHSCAR